MTSHWEILDLEPTQDERLVRRAYAKQLKTIDQDLEPQRFIKLREALEHAQNDIRYGYFDEDADDESNVLEEGLDSEERHDPERLPHDHETPPESIVSIVHAHEIVQPVETQPTSDSHTTFLPESPHQHSRADLYAEARMLADKIRAQDTQADLVATLSRFLSHVEQSLFLLESEKAELRLSLDQAATSVGLDGIDDLIGSHALDPTDFQVDVPLPANETLDSSVFLKKREILYQSLWEDRLDDEIYALFTEILTALPLQTLGIQMQTHDQLAYNLAMARDSEGDVDRKASERFVRYWLQSQGNEAPLVGAHPSLHALHERMLQMQEEDRFWQNAPPKYISAMRHLQDGKGMHYWAMLKLAWGQDFFVKHYQKKGWLNFPVQQREHNFDLHLVQRLSQIHLQWPMIFIVLAASFSIISKLTALDSAFLLFILIIASILWIPFVQAPINAWMQSRPLGRKVADTIAKGWLVSAIILALGWTRLEPVTAEFLVGLWVIAGVITLGHALGGPWRALISWFKPIIRIKADDWYVSLAYIFVLIAIPLLITFFIAGDSGSRWLLALLPIILFNFPEYFRDLLDRMVKPKAYMGSKALEKERMLKRAGGGVLGIFVFTGIVGMIVEYQLDIPLAMVLFISIFIVFIPLRRMAYGLKYAAYVVQIIGSIATVVLPIVGLYLLYQTFRHDRMAWANKQP